jgi:guanylate kinase
MIIICILITDYCRLRKRSSKIKGKDLEAVDKLSRDMAAVQKNLSCSELFDYYTINMDVMDEIMVIEDKF